MALLEMSIQERAINMINQGLKEDVVRSEPKAEDVGKPMGLKEIKHGKPNYGPVEGGGSGLPDPSELDDGTALVVINHEWKMEKGHGYNKDTIIFAEQEIEPEWDSAEGAAFADISISKPIEEHWTYIVTFNGTEYECVANSPSANPSIFELSVPNVFSITYGPNDYGATVVTMAEGKYTLKLRERKRSGEGTFVAKATMRISDDQWWIQNIDCTYSELGMAIASGRNVILSGNTNSNPTENTDFIFQYCGHTHANYGGTYSFICINKFDTDADGIQALLVDIYEENGETKIDSSYFSL